jgi:hypothetical protein
MLRRTAALGERMLQDHIRRQRGGSLLKALLRAALGIVLAGIVAGVGAKAARAQTYGSDSGSGLNKVLQTIGLEKGPDADSGINYTERSPLVVPPTRDLPPPATNAAAPAPDWPSEPPKRSKASKSKQAVVPDTAVQTPNPQVQKKPWYNPMGWFDKEEYANFAGEPVRGNLTDPPAGYRIPSPEHPYGIGPDKKPGKAQATASDFNMGSAVPSGSGSGK